MSEEQKEKRFAIKILEKDYDKLAAYQEKWTKQKKEEFSLNEVVDYVMQTGIVRVDALEKYAKKQKAKRKAEKAEKPPKEKKAKKAKTPKEPKEKKARKTKAPKAETPATEPVTTQEAATA